MPVVYAVSGSTMHIELARPTKRNAIDQEMAEQLEEALDVLEERADLRVAVISGSGRPLLRRYGPAPGPQPSNGTRGRIRNRPTRAFKAHHRRRRRASRSAAAWRSLCPAT